MESIAQGKEKKPEKSPPNTRGLQATRIGGLNEEHTRA